VKKVILLILATYVDLIAGQLLLPFGLYLTPPLLILNLSRNVAAVFAAGYFYLLGSGLTVSCLLGAIFYLVAEYSKQGGTYRKGFSMAACLAGVNLSVLSWSTLESIDWPYLVLTNLVNLSIYILVIRRELQVDFGKSKTQKLW
jgi:hypothetical protein